jgi:polyhydroxybutyrate depolymerase
MKSARLVLTLLVLSWFAAPVVAQSPLRPGDHRISIRHAGRARSYLVHVPKGSGPFPAVIAYHGGGGEAQGFKEYAGLDAIADRERFIVVYPNGSGVLPNRLLTFNGGGCCGFAKDRNIDDVGFTMALLDDLARKIGIDRKRVYATGHSNGAIMAYRLAAERADRIAAVVGVAGAMSVAAFAPKRPVAVLHIHSVDDPRALYDGGIGPPFPGTDHRETHQPVQAGLDLWIRLAGCSPSPVVAEQRRTNHTAQKLVWSNCRDNVEVAHWKLTGAGHAWPGNARQGALQAIVGPPTTVVDAAEEIWGFASRFILP